MSNVSKMNYNLFTDELFYKIKMNIINESLIQTRREPLSNDEIELLDSITKSSNGERVFTIKSIMPRQSQKSVFRHLVFISMYNSITLDDCSKHYIQNIKKFK